MVVVRHVVQAWYCPLTEFSIATIVRGSQDVQHFFQAGTNG
jgi:hypothetical protein